MIMKLKQNFSLNYIQAGFANEGLTSTVQTCHNIGINPRYSAFLFELLEVSFF